MKINKILLLSFLITSVLTTKSCCWGSHATEKTVDYGSLPDSLKNYFPYIDYSTVLFLDTNNVPVEFLISKELRKKLIPPSKCKFCCKGILTTYKWESDEIFFSRKSDTLKSTEFQLTIENNINNSFNFYFPDSRYYQFLPDSIKSYEYYPKTTINSKTYQNVYKLYNKHLQDSSSYLLFNKENGILKVNYKTGKSISLL